MDKKIIGIDPAPSKDTVFFDGDNFKIIPSDKILCYIEKLLNNDNKAQKKLYLAWDSPLIELPIRATNMHKGSFNFSPFYTRAIEYFFQKQKDLFPEETNNLLPGGISVQSFAGCPHWVITQSTQNWIIDNNYGEVVRLLEVHPAVAIWLWCESHYPKNEEDNWFYKDYRGGGVEKRREKILKWLDIIERQLKNEKYSCYFKKAKGCKDEIGSINTSIKNCIGAYLSDFLDAFIAWLLCYLKEYDHKHVMVLGDIKTGKFILPKNCTLKTNWEEFMENMT